MIDTPETRAAAARLRLSETLGTLKSRLAPASLARNAMYGVVAKGEDLTRDGVEVARRNPAGIGAVAAAIGLFLARRPIARLFSRRKRATASDMNSSISRPARAGKRNAE